MKSIPVIMFILFGLCSPNPGFPQTAAAAVTAPADPWKAGTNEYILFGTYGRDQLTGHWTGNAQVAWGHFVSDNTEVGSITSFVSTGTVQGTGVGGFYEWTAGRIGKADIILGGDAQRLTGDLTQAATYQASTRIGLKAHVGKQAAVRASIDWSRALNQQDPTQAPALNGVQVIFGVSLALPQ